MKTNFIEKWNKSFRADKKGHFIVGAFVTLVTLAITEHNILITILALQSVSLGKEVYDSFFPKKHTVDINDYFATISGGVLILTFNSLIEWIFSWV